jgi:acyl carrier protein phosphodiesterase
MILTRLQRPFELSRAVEVLEHDYEAFHGDFTAFFPEVAKHVQAGV